MKQQGLTLIEVLIALAIMAIAFTALLKSMATQVHNTKLLEDKLTHHWIAMQVIYKAQLALINVSTTQPTTESLQWLGKRYYYHIQPASTAVPHMQRITVAVGQHSTGPFQDPLQGYRFISVLH